MAKRTMKKRLQRFRTGIGTVPLFVLQTFYNPGSVSYCLVEVPGTGCLAILCRFFANQISLQSGYWKVEARAKTLKENERINRFWSCWKKEFKNQRRRSHK
jgi:hypothetical protein